MVFGRLLSETIPLVAVNALHERKLSMHLKFCRTGGSCLFWGHKVKRWLLWGLNIRGVFQGSYLLGMAVICFGKMK